MSVNMSLWANQGDKPTVCTCLAEGKGRVVLIGKAWRQCHEFLCHGHNRGEKGAH